MKNEAKSQNPIILNAIFRNRVVNLKYAKLTKADLDVYVPVIIEHVQNYEVCENLTIQDFLPNLTGTEIAAWVLGDCWECVEVAMHNRDGVIRINYDWVNEIAAEIVAENDLED